MKTHHTKHATYKLAYHFVWCPKYRKRLLVGRLAVFVGQIIREVCEAQGWGIGALNIQCDHVHLFLSAPPAVSPSEIAHRLKGVTARRVFQRFPALRGYLHKGHLWSRSYYVGSVGDMSMQTVIRYIELGQD